MSIPARRQPHPSAYTIIESLVVLVILAILTMLVVALAIHEKEPAKPSHNVSVPMEPIPPDKTKDSPE